MPRRTVRVVRFAALPIALAAVLGLTRCAATRSSEDDSVTASDAGNDGGSLDGSIACQVKYECPIGQVCELAQCQAPPSTCRADADCPAGQICDAVTCVPGCDDPRDCAAPQICDLATSACAVCSATNPCPTGATCTNGVCQAPCTSAAACQAITNGEICSGGMCTTCSSNNDCDVAPYSAQMDTCQGGLCLPPDAGSCTNQSCQAQLGALGYCNSATNMCAVYQCLQDSDCMAPQTCDTSTHTCQTPATCNTTTCSQMCNAQQQMCDMSTCTCTQACNTNSCNQMCQFQGQTCDTTTCSCTPACNMNSCVQMCAQQQQQCDQTTCTCMAGSTGSADAGSTCSPACTSEELCVSGTCQEISVQANSSTKAPCSVANCFIPNACVGAESGMTCSSQGCLTGVESGNYSGPYPCN